MPITKYIKDTPSYIAQTGYFVLENTVDFADGFSKDDVIHLFDVKGIAIVGLMWRYNGLDDPANFIIGDKGDTDLFTNQATISPATVDEGVGMFGGITQASDVTIEIRAKAYLSDATDQVQMTVASAAPGFPTKGTITVKAICIKVA